MADELGPYHPLHSWTITCNAAAHVLDTILALLKALIPPAALLILTTSSF